MESPAPALQLDTFLPYMRDVVRCEESLRELNLTWRMIEAGARINCPREARSILPMMTATRQGFERLEKDLVESLVSERVAHVLDEVGTKASHVVNIIVRNLYERTADVGFLSTDRDLCEFMAGAGDDRDDILQRLRAYRDKYTVYDDILLVDAQGNVRVHLDPDTPVLHSQDPLLAATWESGQYVETFRASDLRPGKRCALIYSRAMHGPDGRIVGALCLSFDFEREMRDIFRSRCEADGDDRAVMLLLDGENRVIASADEHWIPVGAKVPVHHGNDARTVMHAGREYLVRSYRADGYQGYPGPSGWQGSVMIPIEVAFTGRRNQTLDTLAPQVAAGLLTHARSFCPPLHQIITAARTIRRVVWNGQVMTAGQRQDQDQHKLKAILEQVSDTGARTNALFSEAIRNLYDIVLGATRRSGEFTARLLVDLLDRNLYERSNDCRWWALTPQLRQIMADGTAQRDRAILDGILQGIHALYTVYSRLAIYDTQGRIVAGTALACADGGTLLDQQIEAGDLQAVLALRDMQSYHVSEFRGGVLSEGIPSHVYHAAIRAPHDPARIVGGIGIVFDSARELRAMLADGLVARDGGSAVFMTREGKVIAASGDSALEGQQLDLPQDMLQVPAGVSRSGILVRDGQYMAVACSANSGYREFKVTDGYRDDVLAVVFDPLGTESQERPGAADPSRLHIAPVDGAQDMHEYAMVVVDGQLYALDATHVLQASTSREIVRIGLNQPSARLGTLPVRDTEQAQRYVWVYDLVHLLKGRPAATLAGRQVVVARHRGQELGLLVDDLHGVPEFPASDISDYPYESRRGLVSKLIRANQGALLLPVIDLDAVWARLDNQFEIAPAVDAATACA